MTMDGVADRTRRSFTYWLAMMSLGSDSIGRGFMFMVETRLMPGVKPGDYVNPKFSKINGLFLSSLLFTSISLANDPPRNAK